MTCENCGNKRTPALYPGGICQKCNEEMPQYKIAALILEAHALEAHARRLLDNPLEK